MKEKGKVDIFTISNNVISFFNDKKLELGIDEYANLLYRQNGEFCNKKQSKIKIESIINSALKEQKIEPTESIINKVYNNIKREIGLKPTVELSELKHDKHSDTRFDTKKERVEKIDKKEITSTSDIPTVVREIKELFINNYYIDDIDIIDIPLAVSYTHCLPEDPVWLLLIGQPAGIKTELIRSFGTYTNKYIHPSSIITEKALASGSKLEKEKPMAARLHQKIWLIKDLTTILESRQEVVSSVSSRMREIYDGYINVDSGVEGGSKDIPHTKTTLIAGVTPVIDTMKLFKSNMGERVVHKRIPIMKEEGIKKLKNVLNTTINSDEDKRKFIYNKMNEFLYLVFKDKAENLQHDFNTMNSNALEVIYNLAQFIAKLRVTILWNYNNTEIEEIGVAETPARLTKQLKKLTYSLRIIRGKPDVSKEEILSITKVALDTIHHKRFLVLIPFVANYPNNRKVYNSDLMKFIKKYEIPVTSARRILQELELINVIESSYEITDKSKKVESAENTKKTAETHKEANENNTKIWKLTDEFFTTYQRSIRWFSKVYKDY